jgi:hypothetical protein
MPAAPTYAQAGSSSSNPNNTRNAVAMDGEDEFVRTKILLLGLRRCVWDEFLTLVYVADITVGAGRPVFDRSSLMIYRPSNVSLSSHPYK